MEELQDDRPEYSDDLTQAVGAAYGDVNDIYFQLYYGQSAVRMNDFAESGLDDESDERAEEQILRRVERVRRETMTDLADDRWESIVAIDTKTGEKVFWRYGSRSYTFLQEEQRKMVEGREIALIHNHPNNTAASQADLEGAFWLGAKSLTVVTPSGYRYVYIRGAKGMELAAVINDPNYVANPSWREDVESSTAFWTQTLAEKGNQPEWVMEQEDQVVIDIAGGTPIYLPPLKDVTLGVSQTLAEHLWSNMVREGLEGVPISHVQVNDMRIQWQILSQTETSIQRDDAYTLRYEMLKRVGGVQSGIKFFHAAQTVNHIMSLGEYRGNIILAGLSGVIDNVTDNFDKVGMKLIDHNDPILAMLLENEGKLPSPYHNSLEDMDASTTVYVDTAIDWDIHMVWQEQNKVGEFIKELDIDEEDLEEITDLFSLKDRVGELGNFAIGESAAAIDWATRTAGSSLDFAKLEDRITLGIAMIFQKQGYDEDDFKAYYDEMIKWVNRQAGQDKFRLPKVGEVLPQYD
ncbi:MAG: hypothetical protein OXG39_06720 [Chloroflexi bacterium]|nr:hypothetical protein [Chloroflexota bacterium]